ncbi:MAG: hypothetical protein U5K72_08185 [Balneolaceae bacterium]|nr:hypothetical protein [Balneolaceae bacterium]
MPHQLKLDDALLDRKAVQESVKWFDVSLAINTMAIIEEMGFTPQKPAKPAYEQRPAEVKQRLAEHLPCYQKQAQREDAEIHRA